MRLRLPLLTPPGPLRRFQKSNDGAAAVEFALVATPFFFLLFAIVEVGIALFAGQLLETGTQDASRLVMTGQMQDSAKPKTTGGTTETAAQANARAASEFKTAICNKTSALFTCSAIKVDVQSFAWGATVSVDNPVNCSVTAHSNFGNPSDIVVIRAFYEWPTFATMLNFANCPGNKRQLIATAAFRNEPF